MRRPHLLPVALIATLLALPAESTEPPTTGLATDAAWEVAGSNLIVYVDEAFERGLIRVVGPAGYTARKRLDSATPPTLDLLAEGRVPAADDERSDNRAASDQRLTLLPDGHYRFEAILAGPAGTAQIDGSFFVDSGSPWRRADSNAPGIPGRTEDPDATLQEPPQALSMSDSLILTDDNNNGVTLVELQADNTSNVRLENWQIENRLGDFRIVEDGSGTQNDPRLTLLQDTANGKVGIGTTAPQRLLHLASATLEKPAIRLENNYSGADDQWDIGIYSDYLGFMYQGLFPILALTPEASGFSIVVDDSGVVVNTHLTVWGDFTAISSRSAKQDFLPVDRLDILDRVASLPIHEWEFRESTGARHLGPFAEDFRHAFHLGASDRTISPMDVGGVALAAIQGLRVETTALLAEKDREIDQLARERDLLTERLASLEEKVALLLASSRN